MVINNTLFKANFLPTGIIPLIFSLLTIQTAAQPLLVVRKLKMYKEEVATDSNNKMVELKSLLPNLIYDLHYATKNNFTDRQLYPNGKATFLRLPVAKALSNVQQQLNEKGYALKIWDAYRPYRVTKKMWQLVHDERYVADPAKGSGHNRGIAVDVTIVDSKTGKELNMGTSFDNFTDSAHITFTNLPYAVLQNRNLLKQTMEGYGFKVLDTEWWHYSWQSDKVYEVLDMSFKKLRGEGEKERK